MHKMNVAVSIVTVLYTISTVRGHFIDEGEVERVFVPVFLLGQGDCT